MHVLVTGANGYVGGRLVPRLLEAGHTVRVMVRSKDRLSRFAWRHDVEVLVADVSKPESLAGCCDGVDAAYYLIHGMTDSKDFRARDKEAARQFAQAADGTYIIYLGGLQPDGEATAHLASRAEVGEALSACPITEIRAGPVVGSGSASFEMVRYLTERLPVMVTPKWVDNAVRPIAIRDVLAYLMAALESGPVGIVDVGGEPMPFRDMMQRYAKVRGLKRLIFATPVLAPTLAARWVQFITPISNKLAVPLLAGIIHPITGDTSKSRQVFPDIKPLAYEQAVELALARVASGDVETHWQEQDFVVEDWQNLKRETRTIHVDAKPEVVYATVARLGGKNGWLAWNGAWKLRAAMDRAVGGPGMSRSKTNADDMHPGDVVDFWRVDAAEPHSLIRLRAEMKLPGRAWLQFDIRPDGKGCQLTQTALYEPKGLAGWAYWWAVYPIHKPLFKAMTKAIAESS